MKILNTLKKRGVAVLLAVMMCVGMLNLTVFAADSEATEVDEPALAVTQDGSNTEDPDSVDTPDTPDTPEETEASEEQAAPEETETSEEQAAPEETEVSEEAPAPEEAEGPAPEPVEAEVPADVQAFLDVVARIPAEITLEDADAIMAAMSAWDALDWRNADREDVQEAAYAVFFPAYVRLLELEEAPESSLLGENNDGIVSVGYGGTWGRYAVNTGLYSISNLGDYSFHYDKHNGNKIAYCVEPGANYVANGNTTWTPPNNGKLTTEQIRMLVNLVIACGYHDVYKADWSETNYDGSDGNTRARAIATQLLVWEVVVGDRDPDFNLVTHNISGAWTSMGYIQYSYSKSDGYDAVGTHVLETAQGVYGKNMFNSVCGDDYNLIAGKVKEACSKINTAKSSVASLQGSYKLVWNGSNYTYTIPGDFSNCTVTVASNTYGVSANSTANGIVITSTKPIPSAVKITVKTPSTVINAYDGNGSVSIPKIYVYSDNGTPGGSQDVVACSSTGTNMVTESKEFTVTADEALGSLTVKKTVVANGYTGNDKFTFTITGPENYRNTVTITGSGQTTITDLKAGTYTVAETSNNNYTVDSASKNVTVQAGKTVTATITNTRKTGSLSFSKTVSGNASATDTKSFEFTVSLPNTTGGFSYTVNNANGVQTSSGSVLDNGKITLTAGQTATITGIPVGVNYSVTETAYPEFTTISSGATGTISTSASSATFTNTHKVTSLTISKRVTTGTGSVAYNGSDTFTFDVSLNDGTTKVNGTDYTGPGIYTVTVGNNGSATITNVPVGSTYSIAETVNKAADTKGEFTGVTYTTSGITNGVIDKTADKTVTVTADNRYFDSVTGEIEGYKDWGSVPEELRPDFITVQLWRTSNKDGDEQVFFAEGQADEDGNVYVYATAPGSSLWGYSFGTLPLYAAEGDPYTYSVKETGISYGKDAAARLADYLDTLPGTPKGFGHIDVDTANSLFIIRGTNSVVMDDDTIQWETLGAWRPTYHTDSDGKLVIRNSWLGADDIGEVDFQVKKVDAEDDKPLSGAKFTLFTMEEYEAYQELKDGARLVMGWTLTTDKDGMITFTDLAGGEYVLVEAEAPEGHLLNPTVWTVTVGKTSLESVTPVCPIGPDSIGWHNNWLWNSTANNLIGSTFDEGENGVGILTVTDERIKGHVGITKIVDLDGVDVDTLDLSHEFKIYRGQIDDLAGEVKDLKAVDTMTVSSDGKVNQSALLDYGWYTIVETTPATPDDYVWQNVTFGDAETEQREVVWSTDIDEDGNETQITYTAYEVKIVEHGETVAVTAENFYKRDLGEMSITKTVQGNMGDQDKEWNFTVTLTSPADYVDLLNPVYEYTYTVTDSEGALVLDEDGNPKGGELTFAVPVPEETGEEADEDAADAVEPEYTGTVEAAITLKHGETAVIKGIPVGAAYTVTEAEANRDGYSTSATKAESTIVKEGVEVSFVNYRNSNPTTSLTVNKVWEGDEEETRPDSIQVQLYRNGSAYGSPVTLNAANGWSYRWNGLNTTVTWTAEEIDVPDGYTVSTEQSGTTVTITNTYEDEELEDPDVPLDPGPEQPFEEEELDDPDVPLGPAPDLPGDDPDVDLELPDPDVPLGPAAPDLPDEEIELPGPDVPLAEMPDEIPLTDLPDEDVPMASVPRTGDSSLLWYMLTAVSAAGLAVLTVFGRKKREDENP